MDAVIGTTGYTEIVPILDEILAEAEASQKEAAVEEPKEKSFVNCCSSIDLLPAESHPDTAVPYILLQYVP